MLGTEHYFQILFFLLSCLTYLHAAENHLASMGKTSIKGTSQLVCPTTRVRPVTAEMLLLNLLPCTRNEDCPLHTDLGLLCCKVGENQSRCRHGTAPPKPKPTHTPLLGVIQRHCPEDESLAEILSVQTCSKDDQCWPRICCNKYCRTPALPPFSSTNRQSPFTTLRAAAEYLQCTQPPLLDFFAKPCTTIRDCFPHICCQEAGRKVCRPAKKSILPIFATFVKEAGD